MLGGLIRTVPTFFLVAAANAIPINNNPPVLLPPLLARPVCMPSLDVVAAPHARIPRAINDTYALALIYAGAMALPPSASTTSSILFPTSSPQHSTLFHVDILPAFVSTSHTLTLR